MKIKRSTLLWGAAGVAGVAFLVAPLLKVMHAGNREHRALPPIDIAALAPGHYLRVDVPDTASSFGVVVLVRDTDGKLYVYGLAKANGRVLMPGTTVNGSPSGFCHDFRPDGEGGLLAPHALIECQDRDFMGGKADEWRWSLQGKSLALEKKADLYSPQYSINGNQMLVQQR